MKRSGLLLSMTTLLLMGCATSYYKPGVTQAQINRDYYDCKVTAFGMHSGLIPRAIELDECMKMRYGYERR